MTNETATKAADDIEMSRYVVLSEHEGILQWAGFAEDSEGAVRRLDQEVGIWPEGEPEDVFNGFRVVECSEEQCAEVIAWAERGHPSPEAPDFLDA